MNNIAKIMSLMLFLNISLYIGTNLAISHECGYDLDNCKYSLGKDKAFRLNGDLLDITMKDSLENSLTNYKDNYTDYPSNVSVEWVVMPEQETGNDVGDGGIPYIDVLKISWGFFATLFNVAISPVTLFTTTRLPFVFLAFIGIPYMFLALLSVFMIIRGVSD